MATTQILNTKQQVLLEQSAQGLRKALKQLKNNTTGLISDASSVDDESEGGEPIQSPNESPRSERQQPAAANSNSNNNNNGQIMMPTTNSSESPPSAPGVGQNNTGLLTAGNGSTKLSSSSAASEETVALLTTVLGNIDELMREIQNAAFSKQQQQPAAAVVLSDQQSTPGEVPTINLEGESGANSALVTPGAPPAISVDIMSEPDEDRGRVNSGSMHTADVGATIVQSVEIPTPGSTGLAVGHQSNLSSLGLGKETPSSNNLQVARSNLAALSPKAIKQENDPSSQSASWASPFEGQTEVDDDVAMWLTNTYAADYHREATGFEVKLQRHNSIAPDSLPSRKSSKTNNTISLGSGDNDNSATASSGTGEQKSSSTQGGEGKDSSTSGISTVAIPLADASVNDTLVLDDEESEIKKAKYARQNQRSHPAFCSNRRLLQTLRQLNIPKMEDVNEADFNIFNHHDELGDDVFTHVCLNILLQYNFVWSLQMNVFKLHRYLKTVQGLYQSKNPYHNACHAADVLQTTNVYLCCGGVKENFSDVELFAVLFAALTHDVGHIGINNAFLINTRHPIARLNNDRSPLESMHVMIAFELLDLEDCNFLAESTTFKKEHFDDFRGLVVHSILGTDMKFHTELIKTANDILEDGKIEDDEVRDLFRAIVHAADLSNPMKPLPIYLQWADRVVAEFWQQGDEERRRNIPISMMCDRNGANIAKSQLGFINFIVKPFMSELSPLLPPVWLQRLSDNAAYMEKLTGEQEQERIEAISNLAKPQWVDLPEAGNSYQTVYKRLIAQQYGAGSSPTTKIEGKGFNTTTSTTKSPNTQQSLNPTATTSERLTPKTSGVMTPGGRLTPNASFLAALDLKAQTGERESSYLHALVLMTDTLVEKISDESKRLRNRNKKKMAGQEKFKRVSFTSADEQESVGTSSVTSAPSTATATPMGEDIIGPAAVTEENLAKEWITFVLELQLTATEAAKKTSGTVALHDVDFLPYPLLKPHIPANVEHDLVFEVTDEIISCIGGNEVACLDIIQSLVNMETVALQQSPTNTPRQNITFSNPGSMPSSNGSLGASSPIRETLCRLTRFWQSFYRAEKASLAAAANTIQVQTQVLNVDGGTSRMPPALSPLNGTAVEDAIHNNNLPDQTSPVSILVDDAIQTNGSGSLAPIGGAPAPEGRSPNSMNLNSSAASGSKRHSTLLELLSADGANKSTTSTSWGASAASQGGLTSQTTPSPNEGGVSPPLTTTVGSGGSGLSSRWAESQEASDAVTRGYIQRTRTVEQNRSSNWNATVRAVDGNSTSSATHGSSGARHQHPGYSWGGAGGGSFAATTSGSSLTSGGRLGAAGSFANRQVGAPSSSSRPGEFHSHTPEPGAVAWGGKKLPPIQQPARQT